MSISIKSLVDNGGGGNSLNIIRVYSHNEHIKFVLKDTLNGTIVAGSNSVWNHNVYAFTQLQNNTTNIGFTAYRDKEVSTDVFGKTDITYPVSFRPIFEYKE